MNLHDEIAMVAFELYEARSCVRGYDLDDWLEAERIVLGRHAGQEIEEPEEEDVSEEVAPDVRREIKAPIKGSVEEAEESYINEEMS